MISYCIIVLCTLNTPPPGFVEPAKGYGQIKDGTFVSEPSLELLAKEEGHSETNYTFAWAIRASSGVGAIYNPFLESRGPQVCHLAIYDDDLRIIKLEAPSGNGSEFDGNGREESVILEENRTAGRVFKIAIPKETKSERIYAQLVVLEEIVGRGRGALNLSDITGVADYIIRLRGRMCGASRPISLNEIHGESVLRSALTTGHAVVHNLSIGGENSRPQGGESYYEISLVNRRHEPIFVASSILQKLAVLESRPRIEIRQRDGKLVWTTNDGQRPTTPARNLYRLPADAFMCWGTTFAERLTRADRYTTNDETPEGNFIVQSKGICVLVPRTAGIKALVTKWPPPWDYNLAEVPPSNEVPYPPRTGKGPEKGSGLIIDLSSALGGKGDAGRGKERKRGRESIIDSPAGIR
ncbi:MAG TPA: hypothetical protein VGI40_09215 [Pirellulaceae bacterium]|jgi:hypothetical protein